MMLPGDLLTTRHATIIEAPMIPMGFEKFAFFKVKPNFICMCVGCETIDGEDYKWVLLPSGKLTRIVAADLVPA